MKNKYYEVTFYDQWYDDCGCLQEGVVTETITPDRLEWYKTNCDLYNIKETNTYKRRKIEY